MSAYPNLLALRFLFAVVLAYAAIFAMAAGTIRTTLWTITGLVLLLAMGGLLNEALAQFFPLLGQQSLVEIMGSALLTDWGPLGVLTGNWRLIDV